MSACAALSHEEIPDVLQEEDIKFIPDGFC